MKQTLYLLRHAKAEPWSPRINDFDRGLSPRGHDHMNRLSAWMLENLTAPQTVLCSSSRRTRETLTPFLDTWPNLSKITSYRDDIYEATTGTLQTLAGHSFEHSSISLMVGHNPGCEYLALSLMRDSDAGDIEKMAPGTLCVIEFPAGYSADCGDGILRHWVSRNKLPKPVVSEPLMQG